MTYKAVMVGMLGDTERIGMMLGRIICKRLHRGEDLLLAIKKIAIEEKLEAAIVLSGVGCVLEAKVRDARGVTIRMIPEHCEIVSLQGTVSATRTHLHIALAKEDLSTVGGHLVEGCIINTTCELVLQELKGYTYGVRLDEETGYDEIIFREKTDDDGSK
ncbi:PPC domain-containing DNA-binding protein [Anaerosporobacter faecicola]|uniref:PPC domain-containing DNA-binding protein n=1 Tax=Anaerosporobacter faecicola TaxID=2718714 RepID=UPI001EE5B9AC|nr:PPC domain-containing DNA-binding protein [Anaerosporobacter faecicola]